MAQRSDIDSQDPAQTQTPGPWTYRRMSSSEYAIEAGRTWIGVIMPNEPDAALIAAAPDLRSDLEFVESWMAKREHLQSAVLRPRDNGYDLREVLARIRKTLAAAKVEGRQA